MDVCKSFGCDGCFGLKCRGCGYSVECCKSPDATNHRCGEKKSPTQEPTLYVFDGAVGTDEETPTPTREQENPQ
jgi:hypothetical protein